MTELGGKGKYFLAGETVILAGTQLARGLWTVDDTALFLKNRAKLLCHGLGFNGRGVIHHSTQHVRDDDPRAIATYLKALPPGENELPAPSKPRAALTPHTPDTLYTSRGGLAYAQFCGDCHRADGGGVNRISPAGRQPDSQRQRPGYPAAHHSDRRADRRHGCASMGVCHARFCPAQ
ncbi:MAG: hypothetical protein U1E47_02085 [Rivihabitans pingtungensis]